ncbi:MAG: hypothetical protein LQ340_000160, partial [Diploschistes diacapsis]
LPRNDAEHLLYPFARRRRDLVADIPPHVVAPETAAGPLVRAAAAAIQQPARASAPTSTIVLALIPAAAPCSPVSSPPTLRTASRWRLLSEHPGPAPRAGRRRVRGVREERLGDIGDAALEGHFAPRCVLGDEVCFCAHHVQDHVVAEVIPYFIEPASHFHEGGLVDDGVDEDYGGGAAVVELLLLGVSSCG